MVRSIRRQLYFLHADVVTTMLIFAVLAASAFRQPAVAQKVDELTAQRINIVDANGGEALHSKCGTARLSPPSQ